MYPWLTLRLMGRGRNERFVFLPQFSFLTDFPSDKNNGQPSQCGNNRGETGCTFPRGNQVYPTPDSRHANDEPVDRPSVLSFAVRGYDLSF